MHGERTCKTPEEFKAWSQDLGHEQVLTTLSSYGEVSPHRQAQIIKRLSSTMNDFEIEDAAKRLVMLARSGA